MTESPVHPVDGSVNGLGPAPSKEAALAMLENVGGGQSKPEASLRPAFRWHTGADLCEELPPTEWMFEDLWPKGSYGGIGAEKKTLKTYVSLAAGLAQASGKDFLGYWKVPTPGPVIYFIGEGGEKPNKRRLQRIAKAYDIDLREIPFHLVTGAAALTSTAFIDGIKQGLDAIQPSLVVVDPYYAFHPQSVQASNLYERGYVLHQITDLITKDGSALQVVDHFNETGTGFGLHRFAYSGMAAWVDSWWLLRHKHTLRPEDIERGHFELCLEAGSRQDGGGFFEITYDVGAENDIAWSVSRPGEFLTGPDPFAEVKGNARAGFKETLEAIIAGNLEWMNQAEIAKRLGVDASRITHFKKDTEIQGLLDKYKKCKPLTRGM